MERRRAQQSALRPTAMPARTANEGAVAQVGRPRTAWSNRIWMYQRNGRRSPQKRANPFIPKIGNPTPAKPNAGEHKQARCRAHENDVATKRDRKEPVDDAASDRRHHYEDAEQGR